jgi:hypothetical protein
MWSFPSHCLFTTHIDHDRAPSHFLPMGSRDRLPVYKQFFPLASKLKLEAVRSLKTLLTAQCLSYTLVFQHT